MFVRLDELCHGPTGDVRWQEKARWIKFEEDVEEEAHRWGKPHLASISFRSMVDLRKCLKKGELKSFNHSILYFDIFIRRYSSGCRG
jgi:hypothetical protein